MNIDPGEAEFQGRNLFAKGLETTDHLPVLSECAYATGHWVSLRAEGQKTIRYPDYRLERFNLNRDPGERVNLYGRDPEADAAWVKRLEFMVAESRVATRRQAHPVEITPEVECQLRALGYVK